MGRTGSITPKDAPLLKSRKQFAEPKAAYGLDSQMFHPSESQGFVVSASEYPIFSEYATD